MRGGSPYGAKFFLDRRLTGVRRLPGAVTGCAVQKKYVNWTQTTGMREAKTDRTTRQRVTDRLREEPMAAAAIAREFDIVTSTALTHVEHIAQSLEHTDEQLLVAPPTCRDCGFEEFDDLVNRPSRCPECKSEDVGEPIFRIE